MSGFLDPKPLTVAGLDTAVSGKITTPGSAVATALNATILDGIGGAAVDPDGILPYTFSQRANVMPNAKEYGAVGDGVSRPLSTRFATLAAAQAVYPAATALTDELDWAVMQTLINQYSGFFLPLPSLRYVINKSLTATSPVIVGDRRMSRIYMTATNTPITSFTTNVNISYIRLTYSTQQTAAHTNSDAIRLFNVQGATIEKVRIDFAARGIFNYGGGYTFSSTIRDCAVGYASITSLDIRNGGGITGNIIDNFYCHNNPISESATNVSAEPPIQIAGWDDGVLRQINIEHTQSTAAIAISANNLTVEGLHIEGFTLLGDFNAPVNLYGNKTQLKISGYSVIFSKFLIENIPSGNACALFKVTDGVKVEASAVQERNNTVTATGAALVFVSAGTVSASFEGYGNLSGFGGNAAGTATKVSVVKRWNNSVNYDIQNTKYVIFSDTAPTSWTWAAGDRAVVRNPVEAGTAGSKYITAGYRCVTSGTPGTWLPERVLTGN